MIRRQDPDRFYAYPEHRPWWSRLLWRLGFDPLLVRERLRQSDIERRFWLDRVLELEARLAKPEGEITGSVAETGGGLITIVVDRDTPNYPPRGVRVSITPGGF